MRYAIVALAVACTGTTEPGEVRVEEVRFGGSCLDSGSETVLGATADGGTVHVSHQTSLSCCIDGVDVDAEVSGSTVAVTYTERGTPCDCMCQYSVTYDLVGLGSGDWTIEANGDSVAVTVP